ncbi:3-alpha domain-containing protein [Acinetobacter baumannii]
MAYVNQSKYDEKASRAAIERILQVEALADSWRQSFAKRLAD